MTLQSCNAVVPQKKPFSNSFLLAHLLSLTKHIERATPNDTILNFESCTLNIVTNPGHEKRQPAKLFSYPSSNSI